MINTEKNFRTKLTKINHKRTLLKTFEKLDYPVYFKTQIKSYDVLMDDVNVDIAIDIGSSYLIGFNRGYDRFYRVIADWNAIDRTINLSSITFLKTLEDQYFKLISEKKNKIIFLFEENLPKMLGKFLHSLPLKLSKYRLFLSLWIKKFSLEKKGKFYFQDHE
ncbi:MAG: hypothetical protein OEV44_07260 [Spirochaetota bacterium]|nr:hypothetical protein [Spirochaetota bacterium]